ncbi:mitochondrial coenzyme A diphosphatase NUDT8 [Patella vulgata]|uniref:mitochondrial coenzyme A diphosphatase NUDT8 n=1 Tax=Patella vulgata TaxID=6465 RepID=UPI0024A8CD22|nr:mitochondrial coenzyme A diphosphatase NUDT8 [Patella vulgata]
MTLPRLITGACCSTHTHTSRISRRIIPTVVIYWKQKYSTRSSPTADVKSGVNLENIFSDKNKERVKKSLLSIQPVRTIEDIVKPKHKPLKINHDAAVIIPLCVVNDEPSVLFTLRSSSLRKHRGEVSFPGGRKDDSDPDLIYTAVRETWEELGIPKEKIDVWGPLSPAPNKYGTSFTTPVLAYCGHIDISKLVPNEDEVEVVFTRTIESIIKKENIASTQWKYGRGYTMPVFIGGEYRIWGLTAIFLHQALIVLAPGLYTNKVRHNP